MLPLAQMSTTTYADSHNSAADDQRLHRDVRQRKVQHEPLGQGPRPQMHHRHTPFTRLIWL
jgi:hypothetical protein